MPAIKWYINLRGEYEDVTKTNATRGISLEATRNFGHGRSRKGGRKVSWTMTQSGPHDEDLEYVEERYRARFSMQESYESRKGKFSNTLYVEEIGGRTYSVSARKSTGTDNVTFNKQFESWRRVYYTLHYMNDHCKSLFNRVEDDIKAIFADVYIELKARGKRSCLVNEETTNPYGDGGVTLKHTYNNSQPARDRKPHHLRAVLARDISHNDGFGVHWTMDATTTDNPAKTIGISSKGTNNCELVYRNDIAKIDAVTTFSSLEVYVHLAEVTVPGACLTRATHHRVTVDLSAHNSTDPHGNALNGGCKGNITGKLKGRRCAAGWVSGEDHGVEVELSKATAKSSAVNVGSAKIWTTTNGTKVHIEDPQILLDTGTPAEQLEVTLADKSEVSFETSAITCKDEHTLELDLSGKSKVKSALEGGQTVKIELVRHGALAKGEIEDEAEFEFDWKEFTSAKQTTRRKITMSINQNGRGLSVEASWLHLSAAATDALTLNIETLGAPINVPATAVSVPTPQTLEIDLSAHVSLQPAAQAMANNGKLTIDGKLNGLHALGGYSPQSSKHFIALTARKLTPDEPDTVTARRIKLVFCHELGHALGLTTAGAQNYTRDRYESNDQKYSDEYGGQGEHCSYNAHRQPAGADHGRESTSSGEVYVHDGGGGKLCIMYHTMALTQMGDDFCPACKAALRRAKVTLG